MHATAPTPAATTHGTGPCDPYAATTRSLLAYGVLAGPFYVAVSLAQALTRDGFDLGRHSWSLLANGPLGWVQMANLVLTGLMTLAFAVGLRRALVGGTGATWAPRLVGVYGVSLVAAGAFRADPADGFPVGTPAGAGSISWHGLAHLASGAVGFAAFVAACVVLARRYAREGRRARAAVSTATGVLFLAAFAGIASGAGSRALTVAFVVAVVASWAWVAELAAHLYRAVGHPSGAPVAAPVG